MKNSRALLENILAEQVNESSVDILKAHIAKMGKHIRTPEEVAASHEKLKQDSSDRETKRADIEKKARESKSPTTPIDYSKIDMGYGKGRYMGDDVNISATAVNESKIKDPSMQRISRELLESVLIEQPAALIESSQDANKWLATANHALNNADGSTGMEHHKWMAVHHKAMAIHAHKTGNSDAEQLHDKMSERHSDHVPLHDDEDHPDEHFHNGVSHHWNRF